VTAPVAASPAPSTSSSTDSPSAETATPARTGGRAAQAYLPGYLRLIQPHHPGHDAGREIENPVHAQPRAVKTREPATHDANRPRRGLGESDLVIVVAVLEGHRAGKASARKIKQTANARAAQANLSSATGSDAAAPSSTALITSARTTRPGRQPATPPRSPAGPSPSRKSTHVPNGYASSTNRSGPLRSGTITPSISGRRYGDCQVRAKPAARGTGPGSSRGSLRWR
jgi:hypothetical protein